MAVNINPILSIVMPIYNEEECIKQVIEDVHVAILSKLPDSELLAIDDGSQDATPIIIDNLSKQFSQVIPLHKKNGGHGDALLYGVERAKGNYIFLIDSDGQTDPNDFWQLWEKRDDAEFICGVRAKRHDPLHRLMIARLLRYVILLVFGVRCRDSNVPFKLLTRDFWETISELIPKGTLTPSLFICMAAKRSLNGFLEVNIRHLPRETGTCTIRYLKLLCFCTKAFFQFVKFRCSAWRHLEPHHKQGV